MYIQLMTLLFCATTIAFPLNINLGAFSPALVVGDGEISFGEAKEAEGLVNTLAGASAGTSNVPAGGAVAGIGEAATGAGGGAGGGAGAAERATKGRSTESADERTTRVAATKVRSKRATKNIEREYVTNDLNTLDAKIGKISLKRSLEARDLAGFTAALKFADGALTKGPSIDLGTGNGGSGVGITIRPPQGGA